MKKFKENITKLYNQKINDQTSTHFSQLVNFIDSAIADSYKKEGDEKVKSLLTYLLSVRDYLKNAVLENSLRQSLLKEAIAIIEELEQLCVIPVSQIVTQRQEKLRRLGKFEEN